MIGELNLAGIFFSPLLLCLFIAFFARLALSWVLNMAGVYRHVWNRPLFDLSLLIILLGAAFTLVRLFTAS